MIGCLAIGVFAVVVIPMILLVVGGAALSSISITESQPTPGPVTPAPPPPSRQPSPPPPPEPEPIPDRTYPPLPPPNSDEPAWVSVQQASIYAVEFPDLSGCPEPAILRTMGELQPYVTSEFACVQAAWQPVLAGLGLPSSEIPHYYYDGESATSPCGTTVAPAFYCSANGGSIYFGEGLLRGTSYDPIWGKNLVGHEYGHHLQAASGFFDLFDALPAGNETLRRNEIQATCMALAMMRRDDSITLDRAFYDELDPHLRSILEDGIHGSPDSLAYWGLRGFHGDLVGECNTWVVDSGMVS